MFDELFLGWLLLAALSSKVMYFDVSERCIGNFDCILILLVCNVIYFYFYFSVNLFFPLIIISLGLVLSALGWLGGGDAKLFAAYSTAILPENLFITVLLILIIGGVVSLCCLIKNKWTKSADRGVPYGVAIVIGSLFGIWISF